MIGIRSAFSIRARGHWPHLEAVYMTAPRSVCQNTKKSLADRGPSIHDGMKTSPACGERSETERKRSIGADTMCRGLSERTHPHVTPTPASASLWPTLPTKGEGSRKHRVSRMNVVSPQKLKLNIDKANAVSALLLRPSTARACFVFAHGAGAGMTHEFMERISVGLFERNIATLRYQ